MCTVTFFPSEDGYFLTTNRDEKISRANVEWPAEKEDEGYRLLYPKDLAGMGTWIAADNRNNAVCLLNGAFTPHVPRNKYRHSRGLIVTGIFAFRSIREFMDSFDLDEIEPFTLVMIRDKKLFEFKWDGMRKYLIDHDWQKPRIWSSVTLYSPEMVKQREGWFEQWITEEGRSGITAGKILSFHQSGHFGSPEFTIKMKRESVQTISITGISSTCNELVMKYIDLVNGIESSGRLKIKDQSP